MSTEAVLEKIKACLRIAEDGSGATPAEMEAALKKAHELMLKYNIDNVSSTESIDIGEDEIYLPDKPWIQILISGVISLNFCCGLMMTRSKYKSIAGTVERVVPIRMIGSKLNRHCAIDMINYLADTIAARSNHIDFRLAAASAIAVRISDIIKERNKRPEVTNLPVSLDTQKEKSRTYMDEKYNNPSSIRPKLDYENQDEVTKGRAFGKTVQLGPQIKG